MKAKKKPGQTASQRSLGAIRKAGNTAGNAKNLARVRARVRKSRANKVGGY